MTGDALVTGQQPFIQVDSVTLMSQSADMINDQYTAKNDLFTQMTINKRMNKL